MRRLVLLLAILTLVSGCSRSTEGGPGSVTLWHSYRGAEGDALEAVADQFNATHDDIELTVLVVPSDAYKPRLQAAIPRKNGPDLFIEAHELTGEWSRSNLIVPALATEPAELARYVPATVDALRFDDQVWGIPIATKSLALFHNRRFAATAPSTMSELLRVGRRAGVMPLAYETGDFYRHAPILHAFGGEPLDAEGQVRLTEEGIERSLRYVRQLIVDGDVPREADSALVSTLFNQGEVAFVFNGPWFLGEIRGDVDFGVAPLPVLDETGQPLQPFLTVEALFRARHGTASDEAVMAVVEAIAGLDGSVRRAVEGRQIPALRAALDAPDVAADPVLSAFALQSETARAMPNRPEMSFVWEPANGALKAALRGDDPAELLATAQREVESFLAPPAEPASTTPYLVLAGLLLLAAAGWSVREARRYKVVSRARKSWRSYLYLGPAFIGMTAVVFVPFVVGSAVSLFAHRGGEFTFVGLRNFVRILTSDTYSITDPKSFWFTLVVTVVWTAANVAMHVGLGLGLALLLRDPWMKLKGIYRVLLIVPWAVPSYITALIWKGMFNEQLGAVNGILAMLGVEPVAWFSRFATSFAANLCTNTWLGFPFMMVVTLGALQAIPRDLEEAAEVDGAGAWTRFRHVTLPLLKPTLMPAVILGSVWTFNMFNVIYLVSAGEPGGSTEILISEAYKWAFERSSQYGYAAAYAVLVFGVLILYTALTRRVTGGEVT